MAASGDEGRHCGRSVPAGKTRTLRFGELGEGEAGTVGRRPRSFGGGEGGTVGFLAAVAAVLGIL